MTSEQTEVEVMKRGLELVSANLKFAKLLSHYLRVGIVDELINGTLSPKEASVILGVSVDLVSYHFRELLSDDAIVLVRETPVRGAIEHHYELSDDMIKYLRAIGLTN